MVRAYQHKAFDDFKRYYHSLDLLLIDDIQFFSGKSRTQEEFFYAFNALIEAHKQVVITCDTYPKEIAGIEDRLISRFGWGLTVAVEPPELEMRVAILLKKAEAERVKLDEEVAFFIAKHIQSNVRELEGGLKRVLAYARFSDARSFARSVPRSAAGPARGAEPPGLDRKHPEDRRRLLQDQGLGHVLEEAHPQRRPAAAGRDGARQGAHAAEPAGDRRAFGGRDHTTVLHACRKIADLRAANPDITRDFDCTAAKYCAVDNRGMQLWITRLIAAARRNRSTIHPPLYSVVIQALELLDANAF